jgi:hypothetical protein
VVELVTGRNWSNRPNRPNRCDRCHWRDGCDRCDWFRIVNWRSSLSGIPIDLAGRWIHQDRNEPTKYQKSIGPDFLYDARRLQKELACQLVGRRHHACDLNSRERSVHNGALPFFASGRQTASAKTSRHASPRGGFLFHGDLCGSRGGGDHRKTDLPMLRPRRIRAASCIKFGFRIISVGLVC